MANWISRFKKTENGRRLLEQERLMLETAERICALMREQGVTQSELGRRLDTSQANISKLLRGTQNFTLRTLSDIFFWLGRSAHLYDAPVGDEIRVHDEFVRVTHAPEWTANSSLAWKLPSKSKSVPQSTWPQQGPAAGS